MRFPALFALLLLPAALPAQTLTAAQAIQRIQQRYPAPANPATVDTVKAGDPATPVTGIATTFMDTMEVLREAAAHGDNLIITHEPTFYNHLDDTTFFATDPVYLEKRAFIEQHHMVVFRLHDEIHASKPDPIAAGLIDALGWRDYSKPDDPFHAVFPPVSLEALAKQIQLRLKVQTMRVVGDPALLITHAVLRPGSSGLQHQVSALRGDDAELLIAGEASEWETVVYARDAYAQGRHKALILLGHEVSEEPGMEQCAKDLRVIFPGVRVDHLLANQPLWNPDHPPAH